MALPRFSLGFGKRRAVRVEANHLRSLYGAGAAENVQSRIAVAEDAKRAAFLEEVLKELGGTTNGHSPSDLGTMSSIRQASTLVDEPAQTPGTQEPPPDPETDVAVPYRTEDLQRARQAAMQLRRTYGAARARERCRQMLADARSPADERFWALVLRTIGAAG